MLLKKIYFIINFDSLVVSDCVVNFWSNKKLNLLFDFSSAIKKVRSYVPTPVQ